ncbi:MAG: MlaD family protein [Pseudomonadota bacterium]
MENRSHALMAGLFAIVLLLAAALALWWFSGTRELTHTYLLETRGSVTGLNLEAQVRYRGIRAGKVRDIRPDPADPALLLVEISLGRQYVLTDRTVAKLNQQGITGLAYIMLEEGTEGKGTPLPVDGSARLTIRPGLLDKLGNQAGDIAAQVAELTARLNRLLDERNTKNIARAIDNLAAASDSLRELPRVMAALRGALSDENLGRLNAILIHLEQTAGAAAPLTAEARALVATMGGLARRFDGMLATTGAVGERLDADTLPRAEALMAEVHAATRRLDRLLDTLNDTPQAVLFGATPARPGPGEAGFAAPAGKE